MRPTGELSTTSRSGDHMTLTEHSTTSAPGASGAVTVASLARDWAQRAPSQIAMREKDFGIWHEYTWETTWSLIEEAAFALLALGVQPGDRVSIQSEDRPEWVILDLATVAVRGITVGFYPTNPTAEVEYLLGDCGACVHLAEDQEQFDKVMRSTAAASATAHDPVHRAARHARRRRRPPAVLGQVPRARPRLPQAAPERRRRSHGERPRRRRDDPRLHVGHDRPAEGGDAHQPQLRVLHRQARQLARSRPRRTAHARRPDPHLPPVVSRRRADLLDLDGGQRRGGAQLRRVDRDRQREPPRGAADVVLRRAAHLGEAARGLADQGQRRLVVQEAHAAVRARPGEPDRADQGRPRRRAHDVVACSPQSVG